MNYSSKGPLAFDHVPSLYMCVSLYIRLTHTGHTLQVQRAPTNNTKIVSALLPQSWVSSETNWPQLSSRWKREQSIYRKRDPFHSISRCKAAQKSFSVWFHVEIGQDQQVESFYSGSIAESSISPHWSSSSSSTLNAMEAHWGNAKGFLEDVGLEEYDMVNPLEIPHRINRVVSWIDGEGEKGQS